MKKLFITIFCVLLLSGCDFIREQESEQVKILYKNGNVFCEGAHRVYKNWLTTHKNRIGDWKFYYPNNNLEAQNEYDKNGEVLNSKIYSENGILIYSLIVKDNISIETEYYDSGVIKSETTEKLEKEYDDGAEYEVVSGVVKEYYKNGKLSNQSEYIDDQINGVNKIWDESGDLVLEIRYNNGLIVNQ